MLLLICDEKSRNIMKKVLTFFLLLIVVGLVAMTSSVQNEDVLRVVNIIELFVLAFCSYRVISYYAKDRNFLALIGGLVLALAAVSFSLIGFLKPDLLEGMYHLQFFMKYAKYPLFVWGIFIDRY